MTEPDFLIDDEEDNQIDLTPMLDVVFIMLIFFIVTSTFVKESGVDVSRPSAETAVVTKSNSIHIGITDSNTANGKQFYRFCTGHSSHN